MPSTTPQPEISQTSAGAPGVECDPATRTTKALLAYGVIAGPFYVTVSLAQALTRDGFDLTRHSWSLLANGGLGWLQISNLMLAGVMMIVFAVGLRRTFPSGRGRTWAPRLVGAYGVSLVAAGAFRADPTDGFPAGTPDTAAEVSWHGLLHFAAGGIGFGCLVAACFVIASRFTAGRRRGWAAYSRITGVLFLVGFAGVASGAGGAGTNLGFLAAVLIAWTWISALAAHLYRQTANTN